jgi:7-cyano-7-deazaguanine synthase in queuosine biosynthesis
MRLPRDPEKTLKLDLADLKWLGYGLEQIGEVDPALLDLLEIARVVQEFDRRQPKRTTGVRIKQVDVEMSVREPDRWTGDAKAELSALLRVQGNAEWIFTLDKRRGIGAGADSLFAVPARDSKKRRDSSGIRSVVLFSGGLDSTSGLATLATEANQTLLVGCYAQNRERQLRIANALGFKNFAQISTHWTRRSDARGGGHFWYRSFLFLTLGAVFAAATRAPSLLQFENGPLAFSVPPLDIYRMTRHAHPLVHRHMTSLVKRLTGRRLEVSNPFILKTKGEAVAKLKRHLNGSDFRRLVDETQTCWYLNSRAIVAGNARKKIGEACGACVPCLVRRAALAGDDSKAGVDFTAPASRSTRDPVVRVHYEAYSAFARRLLDPAYRLRDFLEEIPMATRTLFNKPYSMDSVEVFDLYRRFAREWTKAFN